MSRERPVLGIDLGTSNSCVAYVEGDEVRVVTDERGRSITPSVVSLTDNGDYVVGHFAKAQRITNPRGTLYSAKRLIGQDFNSPGVQQAIQALSFSVQDDGNNRPVCRIKDKYIRPVEVSTEVLLKVKGLAETYLNTRVSEAVITVPAHFNDRQRKETIEAAETAGLRVLRLINEPTAAALAYGYGYDSSATIAIYDFGGGTFDISVLEIEDNVFEVIATGGDSFLGGDDLNHAIADFVVEQFHQEKGIDIRQDRLSMQRVLDAAEKAKVDLSDKLETVINLPRIAPNIDFNAHLYAKVTRADVDRLCISYCDRTLEICRKTFEDARIDISDIDDVVLVGGSTRMPLVRERVKQYFAREPNTSVNPDQAVAVGAAIQAHALCEMGEDVLLIDVTPTSFGIESLGNVFTPIIPRNTKVPFRYSKIFTTAMDYQEEVRIKVFQGEGKYTTDCTFLGEFVLSGIRRALRREPQIEVTFRIDANGVLSISARDLDTGKAQSIRIRDLSSGKAKVEHIGPDVEQPDQSQGTPAVEVGGGAGVRTIDHERAKGGLSAFGVSEDSSSGSPGPGSSGAPAPNSPSPQPVPVASSAPAQPAGNFGNPPAAQDPFGNPVNNAYGNQPMANFGMADTQAPPPGHQPQPYNPSAPQQPAHGAPPNPHAPGNQQYPPPGQYPPPNQGYPPPPGQHGHPPAQGHPHQQPPHPQGPPHGQPPHQGHPHQPPPSQYPPGQYPPDYAAHQGPPPQGHPGGYDPRHHDPYRSQHASGSYPPAQGPPPDYHGHGSGPRDPYHPGPGSGPRDNYHPGSGSGSRDNYHPQHGSGPHDPYGTPGSGPRDNYHPGSGSDSRDQYYHNQGPPNSGQYGQDSRERFAPGSGPGSGSHDNYSPGVNSGQFDSSMSINRFSVDSATRDHTAPTSSLLAASPEPAKPDAPELGIEPGRVIAGRYELIEQIGAGAFGAVYKAKQMGIDREVAIKVLMQEVTKVDATAVQRFEREAKLCASLEHPNNITVHDFGHTAEGVLYLVMEYVRGRTLHRTMRKEGRMSPIRAVKIVRQVLLGLNEAHARGIVHRDMKPGNIMLFDRLGEKDCVKVLDFGIAKFVQDKKREAGQGKEDLTMAGRIVGTPRYMAPEQVRGKGAFPASDLYSLGLIFYGMLAGRKAITGDSTVELIAQQMSPEPAVKSDDPLITAALMPIILRSTAKDLQQRYQSTEEFLSDLDRLTPQDLEIPTDPLQSQVIMARTGPAGPRPTDDPQNGFFSRLFKK